MSVTTELDVRSGRPGPAQQRGGVDLLPVTARVPALVLAGLAAAVLVGLAISVAGTTGPVALDGPVDRVIAHHHVLRSWWVELTVSAGEPVTVVVVAVLVAALALVLRRYRLAALAVLGPGLTGVATTSLKPLVGRTIADGSLAFPSGHTAGAAALGLLCAFACAVLVRRGRAAVLVLVAVAASASVGVVALGLVDENAHYPTDTLGGFCVAVVVTVASALVVDRAAPVVRRVRRSGGR